MFKNGLCLEGCISVPLLLALGSPGLLPSCSMMTISLHITIILTTPFLSVFLFYNTSLHHNTSLHLYIYNTPQMHGRETVAMLIRYGAGALK